MSGGDQNIYLNGAKNMAEAIRQSQNGEHMPS